MLKSLGVFKDYSDDSIKSVFDIGDNKIIEMTLLNNKDKMDVICVPTHHFCNMGCKMCHLTKKGLNKKMLAINIDDFIEALIRTLITKSSYINNKIERRTSKKMLLISFMGVGEPLLNLDLIKELYNREKYIKEMLGYEDISYALSTMMPNKNILILKEMVNNLNIPLKVHFSLHTPINEKRKELIPSTKVTIEEALNYLIEYRNTIKSNEIIIDKYTKFHRTNDPIEIHYTLIENVNDSNEELNILCELLEKYKITIKFIRFNEINDLKMSHKENLWLDTIKSNILHLRVKTYTPPGREIGSSCGEFTKHYYHQEIETLDELKEFEDWKNKHQIFE